MLHITIDLILNDKDQIKLLLHTVKKYRIDNPVYIVELDDCISASMESDYEQYELIREFASHFEDYELTDDVESGHIGFSCFTLFFDTKDAFVNNI